MSKDGVGMSSGSASKPAGFRDFMSGNMWPGAAVRALSNCDQLFPTRNVARAGPVRVLRRGETLDRVQFAEGGRNFDLKDFLAVNRVAGLLVLKDGNIVLESYELGIGPETRWASCSIAKSVTSVLVGAALQQGAIGGLDDLASSYVPELSDGCYESVTLRHLITMTSGVRWSEAYTDPNSERRKLLECQLTRKPGAILRHMQGLGRAGEPGSIWNYNTGDSYVLGAVLERATGQSLADYLSEKIWTRAGMERDARWGVESRGGMVLAGSGIYATLRDYGRFGQLIVDGGIVDGIRVVPEGWIEESGSAQRIGGVEVGYGYMWWIRPESDPILRGSFQAEGIYGQCVYVHPAERVVIVVLSARSKPSAASRLEFSDEGFFAAVVKALR